MKKTIKFLVFVLVAFCFCSFNYTAANAKTVTAKYSRKKAPKIKKGTTKVTLKNSNEIWRGVKFKATKTKKYHITFSGLTSTPAYPIFGTIFVERKNYKVIAYAKMCSKATYNSPFFNNPDYSYNINHKINDSGIIKNGHYFTTYGFTCKLKKGETIYIHDVYFPIVAGEKASYSIKIK